MGKPQHRGIVTGTVAPAWPGHYLAFTNVLTPVVFLYLTRLLKIPKQLSRCPPESQLMPLIWLDAFKEIIDMYWFHLYVFCW